MSELTLEKNRPFRMDLENVDFSNIAPDNNEKFKELEKIFDKLVTFEVDNEDGLLEFENIVAQTVESKVDKDIVKIEKEQYEGTRNGNKLLLSSGKTISLSHNAFKNAKQEKRVKKNFDKMIALRKIYDAEDVLYKKSLLGDVIVNIETGEIAEYEKMIEEIAEYEKMIEEIEK